MGLFYRYINWLDHQMEKHEYVNPDIKEQTEYKFSEILFYLTIGSFLAYFCNPLISIWEWLERNLTAKKEPKQ